MNNIELKINHYINIVDDRLTVYIRNLYAPYILKFNFNLPLTLLRSNNFMSSIYINWQTKFTDYI